ncbi:hypothetical protein, partial [Streptomyces brasiliscabiei]|uniref:hypothetical protein n=1 Tax=Streptomyces brasiliscabiei TaxID=2736302 RepID=UPI003014FE01
VCAPAARADAPPSPPRLSVREVHDGPQTCDVRVETMIGGTWVTTGHYGGGPALPLRGRGGLFSELRASGFPADPTQLAQ